MSRLFDGTGNQYITTPASAVYNNLTKETLAGWFYITAYSGIDSSGPLIVKDPNGIANGLYETNLTPATASFQYSSQAKIAISNNSNTLPLATWFHLAATWDSTTGAKKGLIYINGVEVSGYSAQQAGTLANSDSADGYYFGSDTLGDNYTGYMAELAVWNKALSGAEVAALAASTTGAAGVAAANLVGYWHLLGTTSPEPDSTSNGNVGTLFGSPTQGPNSPGYTPPSPAPGVYSIPDCRNYGTFPNLSRNVQNTLTYDVPSKDSRTAGAPVDSRPAGAPVDSRIDPNIPKNSRNQPPF